MTKFKIEWFENKPTSTGKARAIVSLKDEGGKMYEGVTMWGTNWNLAELGSGHEVEGDYKEEQNGQYLNKTLFKPSVAGGRRDGGMKAAQERKETMITKAQDQKQLGIEISSTFRDATAITVAQFNGKSFTDEEFKTKWQEWRNWLTAQFDPSETERKLGF
jgi:hypothetical protein